MRTAANPRGISLNRLTGAAYSTGESCVDAYDEVGNRTALTTMAGTDAAAGAGDPALVA